MAYDHNIEGVRNRLLSIVGASGASLTMPELWDRYLTAIGFTTGTLLDRQAKAAAAAGMGIAAYRRATTALGPELAGTVTDGAWSLSLNGGAAGTVTQDGTGLHFVGAQNIAAAFHTIAGVDNAVFRVEYTFANMSAAGGRPIVYGATNAHSGSGTTRNSAGNYVEYLQTTGGGSFNNQIRIQATGTSGQNSFDVTFVSVKRVF